MRHLKPRKVPIRAARLLALMQTPHRFRSKRQLYEVPEDDVPEEYLDKE